MSALIPGLVSVTFRKLSPQQIVDLAAQAELKVIEWSGDIHVPHGNLKCAQEVRKLTENAGLSIAAYGSYYRLGEREDGDGIAFARALESAVALGAPTIRVWAGSKGSSDLTSQERRTILVDLDRIATLAQAQGITVSLEYHGGTLADTRESVRTLLDELSHPNVEFLWQTTYVESEELNLIRLQEILPRLRHIHIFHWWPDAAHRLPLAEGESSWRRYLDLIRTLDKPMPCLLEFVRDNSPEQFLQDAATLRRWLA